MTDGRRFPWRRPTLAVAAAATLAVPAPVAAAAPGVRQPDPIAGFTFTAGAAGLYAPGQPLRIRAGTTVVWTNLDPVPHDVTFETGMFAAYLRAGESAEHTFRLPGRYLYHCYEHHEFPGMHGLVYVE